MTYATLAKKLKIPQKQLERDSLSAYIEKRVLEAESELVELAQRYGAKTSAVFLRRAKQGKIDDSKIILDDFFRMEYLESEKNQLKRLQALI